MCPIYLGRAKPWWLLSYQEKPRHGGSNEDLHVPPLSEVTEEVEPRGRGDIERRRGHFLHPCLLDFVDLSFRLARHVGFDVGGGLLDVLGDLEGVPRRLGDRDPVVQGEAGGQGSDADDDAPAPVGGDLAAVVALVHARRVAEGVAEGYRDHQCYHGGEQLAEPLHREDGGHHRTAPPRRRELRRDDRAQRVVSAYTHAEVRLGKPNDILHR